MAIANLRIKLTDYLDLTNRVTNNPVVEEYLPELIAETKAKGGRVFICDDFSGLPVKEL